MVKYKNVVAATAVEQQTCGKISSCKNDCYPLSSRDKVADFTAYVIELCTGRNLMTRPGPAQLCFGPAR